MATSIGPTYDPATTAAALAEKYVSGRQQILTTQTKQASAIGKGLSDLGTALSTFQTSLLNLTGAKKTMFAQAATFSDPAFGTASAAATAAAGSYAFFVKQVATASQVSYSGLSDDAGVGGTLGINMNGITIDVALAGADSDASGKLSAREIAAAINAATGNTSLVTASVVTTGGTAELVLTAKNTGAAGRITLDTSRITGASSLAAANDPLANPARFRELVLAQDAEIHVGAENGTVITQATNSFTNVAGVTMNFTKAQASGAAPLTLTVSANNAATTANVQAFIDAYNKLKVAIDGLVDAGDPARGSAGGAFAHDGGMRALRDRLVGLLRPAVGAGPSLAAYGILATREGTLELRAARLTSQLALDPTGLDNLIGSSSTPASGIAGALDAFVKDWTSSSGGKIVSRKQVNARQQTDLTARQTRIDQQYDSAYKRYLLQFTQLQTLQSQMSSNTSMFDALFGDKSN